MIDALERSATDAHAEFKNGLERLGAKAGHRPLRLRVTDLSWEFADDALWLEFRLPSGGFATSVLREVASV